MCGVLLGMGKDKVGTLMLEKILGQGRALGRGTCWEWISGHDWAHQSNYSDATWGWQPGGGRGCTQG